MLSPGDMRSTQYISCVIGHRCGMSTTYSILFLLKLRFLNGFHPWGWKKWAVWVPEHHLFAEHVKRTFCAFCREPPSVIDWINKVKITRLDSPLGKTWCFLSMFGALHFFSSRISYGDGPTIGLDRRLNVSFIREATNGIEERPSGAIKMLWNINDRGIFRLEASNGGWLETVNIGETPFG